MSATTVHNVSFHGVGEPPRPLDHGEAMVWLRTDRFAAILDALHGRDDVRLSFDDSNRSDVDVALPLLLERGMTATFFVLAGRLEDPHHLGVDDLRRLRDAGMTIGSHGLHHIDWRRCEADALARELAESRTILEDAVGDVVDQAAIPFGSYDRRVLAQARRDGRYARMYTSDSGPARAGAWLQPRTSVANDGVAPSALAQPPGVAARAERTLKGLVKRWR